MFVFVLHPAVTDMLQIEIRIPIRSMPVVFVRALPLIESSANPRGDPSFLFLIPLLLGFPLVVSCPSPRNFEQSPLSGEVRRPFHAQVLVG